MTTGDAHGARPAAIFAAGLDLCDDVIGRLAPTDWDRPSPNEGWTGLDTLGHLGTSVQMGTSVLRAEQPSWPEVARPADLVDDEPVAWWCRLTADARAAIDGADLELEMDTPMGSRTVGDRLAFPAIDLYVHAWDLARTGGFSIEIPEAVIAFSHAHIEPVPAEMVRGDNGAFGPEITPPADASPTEAFVAWTGRVPR